MKTIREKYTAAEKLLPWNLKEAVLNEKPKAFRIDDSHFFYSLQERKDGKVITSFRLVNTSDGSETELFDHKLLCELLKTEEIPFSSCDFEDGILKFEYEEKEYTWDIEADELTIDEKEEKRAVSVSPDGSKEVFVKDFNLWMRNIETGKETQLSFDGEKDNAYGKYAEYSGYITERVKGNPEIPDVLWSPDSQYFLTVRLDQRNVKELYILQSYDQEDSDSIRPRLITYKCAFPEDEILPMAYWYICNAEEGTLKETDAPAQCAGGPLLNPRFSMAKWAENSEFVYLTHTERAHKAASLIMIDHEGKSGTIVHEKADTFLNIKTYGELDGFGSYAASNYITEDGKTAFWQSERDGFARLYRYDAVTKECLYPITPEKRIVGEIVSIDEEKEVIYFCASNMEGISDPYYQQLCCVKFDGSDFKVLTDEDAMHKSAVINDMIIDTYSRVDLPPVTVLRKTDGTFIRTLVEADISDLLSRGYIIPERFTVKASDGETDLYGILIRPADFDENKSYPFIDYIYGGMQCYNVPKAFAAQAGIEGREVMGGLEELAQLGFAGIILDGLGTPGRGKKLHEISYENIHGCAGLKDHVYVLPQLKEKYPLLDLERAGMWGNSGGGCATSRAMLEYPDVYKVGVSSAGNHDQRMYNNQWTENYYGLYNKEIYLKGDNTSLAKNLKGHLYIVHGAMDDNVAMSQSIRLIDALIEADKDFDFLILPRTNHNVPANPYFIRKKIDYFVKYLLEEEVPDYRFAKPE